MCRSREGKDWGGGSDPTPGGGGKRGEHVVALHGEKTGEGKGTDGWAGATVPRFE
jgi:hypothetical protein